MNMLRKLFCGAALFGVVVSALADVVEYRNDLDFGTEVRFFMTANPVEQTNVDSGAQGHWTRTGNSFKSGGNTQVCRFYGSPDPGPNSHFYTVNASECQELGSMAKSIASPPFPRWNFEGYDFATTAPVNGTCQAGETPVYRAYNNGFARGVDSNHRITTSLAGIAEVVNRGWTDEGLVMCAPSDVLHYTDAVFVTYIGGYPYAVSKSGITPVKNMTEFTWGFYPLYNCSLYETPIERGIIPVSCYAAIDYGLRIFYIDPTTKQLYQYTGDYVFDPAKWHGSSWGSWSDVPYAAHDIGPTGSYAEVGDGIYYYPSHEAWTLKFSSRDFGSTSIVATGDVDQGFRVIIGYSNP